MTATTRGRLSTLDLLRADAEDDIVWAHRALAERTRAQEDIREELNQRLVARGLNPVSRSAFSRSAVKQARAAYRLASTREIANAVVDRFQPGEDRNVTILVAETIKSMVFEMLDSPTGAPALDGASAEMMANLSIAIKNIETATKTATDRHHRQIDLDRRVAERAAELVRQNADAVVEKIGTLKGLSSETRDRMRTAIMGVLPAPTHAQS